MTAHTEPIQVDPAAHLTSPLVRVRPDTSYFLHYPDPIKRRNGKTDRDGSPLYDVVFDFGAETSRGGSGYVVDWTKPLEREWCKGQEYKLENVPADELATTVATPHGHPQAIRALEAPKVQAQTQDLATKQAQADAERRAAATQTAPKATRARRGYSEIEG